MARPAARYRASAHEAEKALEKSDLPEKLRDFLLELVRHHLDLDERTTARLAELVDALEQEQTIAKSTRIFLLMVAERHDIEDGSGRMQIRTLLGSALIGKPPEAPKGHGRGVRRLADGREVEEPDLSDIAR